MEEGLSRLFWGEAVEQGRVFWEEVVGVEALSRLFWVEVVGVEAVSRDFLEEGVVVLVLLEEGDSLSWEEEAVQWFCTQEKQ